MKAVRYSANALNALRRHRNRAAAIMAKIDRYAETGAGDITQLVGGSGARLIRVGDFRAIFEETEDEILVTSIGSRGSIYE